jgi:hypothetical protein
VSSKCETCYRDPERMNSEYSECSHADCPHRRKAWSDRERPQFKGPWPKKDMDHVEKPIDTILKGKP